MEEALTKRSNQSLAGTSVNSTVAAAEGQNLEFKAIKIVFYFIILFGSAVGNSLVAYIICSNRRMKTASNFLILNLAVCDFSTPLISIPFDFALEENHYVWLYGRVMCRVLWPLATLSATSSALTLAAISLDRYLIIMHPFRSRLTKRQVLLIIIGIHCFSLVVVSPYIAFLKLDKSDCHEDWPKHTYRQTYTAMLFLVQYAFALLFMVTMYTLALFQLYSITAKVRRNKMKQEKEAESEATLPRRNSRKGSPATNGSRTRARKHGVSGMPQGYSPAAIARLRSAASKLSLKRKSANMRATWTFIGIVIIYACFMFPNQFVWLWADFGGGADQASFPKAVIICWLFTYTNSVVNPIIFATFTNDFRNGFRRIFRRIACINRDRTHRFSSFIPESGYLYSANNNGVSSPVSKVSESPRVKSCPSNRSKASRLEPPKGTPKHSCTQVSFSQCPPSYYKS